MLNKKSGCTASYNDFVSHENSEETLRFYSLKNLPPIMGEDTFKNWIKAQFQHLRFSDEIPESRILLPSAHGTGGSVVARMKQREAKDSDFQKILDNIKGMLAKSPKRT